MPPFAKNRAVVRRGNARAKRDLWRQSSGRARAMYPHSSRSAAMPALPPLPAPLVTVLLLTASNVFMTFAWYGHLRFKSAPMLLAILVSWGIAFFEYLLQVPANRIGYGALSAAQLKTIQEVISLTVFVIFNALWLGEPVTLRTLAGFALIVGGVALIFSARG